MSLLTTTQRRGVPGYPPRAMLAATAGTLLIAGFVADLAFLGTADPAWVIHAAWLALAGSVASGFAVMAAFLSATRQRGALRRRGWTGLFGLCTLWGLSVASATVHSHGAASYPAGLALSALGAALVMALVRAHWHAARSTRSGD